MAPGRYWPADYVVYREVRTAHRGPASRKRDRPMGPVGWGFFALVAIVGCGTLIALPFPLWLKAAPITGLVLSAFLVTAGIAEWRHYRRAEAARKRRAAQSRKLQTSKPRAPRPTY